MNIGTEYNTTYGYDDYGRLNQVNDIEFSRASNSDLLGTVTRPNNVNTAWSYEAARNLVSEVNNGAAGVLNYLNNAIGNRTSMTCGSEVLNYTYDNRSEVTGATSSTDTNYVYGYNYDPIGNRLSANLAGTNYSYTANSLNQYTLINTVVPTYDVDGNMLTNGSWTYTWNGENRLTTATDGTKTLTFAYDYMGRRVSKQVSEGATSSAHIRFVYDDYKLIEELDGLNDNTLLRQYSWQSESVGLDVPLTLKIGNDVYSYHTDANKNITDLTDASGTSVAHYQYSPFGQLTAATGTLAEVNPFRFSSEYFDSETNLVYYNYRYYNPQLGCWTNRDPIEEKGGWNLYGMVRNNLISWIDDLGFANEILMTNPANPFDVIPDFLKKQDTPPLIDEVFYKLIDFLGSQFQESWENTITPFLDAINILDDELSNEYQCCRNGKRYTTTKLNCVSLCMSKSPSLTGGKQAPFMPFPKKWIPPARKPSAKQPYTTLLSELQHILGFRKKGLILRESGRILAKIAVVLTLMDGAYSIYNISSCIADCQKNPCAY